MKLQLLALTLACIGLIHGIPADSRAELIFFDDFSDQSAFDGDPVRWRTNGTGSLISSPEGLSMKGSSMPYMPVAWVESISGHSPILADTSLRTQIRLLDGVSVGVITRFTNANWSQPNGYGAAIGLIDSELSVGIAGTGDGGAEGAVTLTDLDPFVEDVVLQLDVIGETISVRAWRPDQAMPKDALLTFTDDAVESGRIALFVYDEDHQSVDALFRYVQVADTQIVDPRAPGDFNANERLDVEDVDLLAREILAATNDVFYDLDGDGLVNRRDQHMWVRDLKKTCHGDANFDGEFTSSDLVQVFTVGLYETRQEAGWAEGDWNADRVFDSQDFVIAFQDGCYETGPRQSVSAVPEPSTAWLLALAAGGTAVTSRRRRV